MVLALLALLAAVAVVGLSCRGWEGDGCSPWLRSVRDGAACGEVGAKEEGRDAYEMSECFLSFVWRRCS